MPGDSTAEGARGDAVARQPEGVVGPPPDLAQQLERTFDDLRALGESVGALPPGTTPTVATRRQLLTASAVALVVAVGIGWLVWDQWHSVFAATAPLVWIVGHSARWRRGRRSLSQGKP